jgi:glyoxylase-like metal-dependent hydrolase (beta-lactamase superfamily II)
MAVQCGAPGRAQPDVIPAYTLFALKYAGPLTSPVAKVLLDTDWDETIDRYYYIWAVQGGATTVVVDCGVRPAWAAQKNLKGYMSPDVVLARIGINAATVEHLVITHIHQDHAGGLELFPRARVYVQKKEFEFWTTDPIAKRKPFAKVSDPVAIEQLGNLRGSDRLTLIDGDQQILPGIEVLLTPGHTPALQSVAVRTAKGLAVLASDCAHVHRSFELDLPSSLISDLPGWMHSYSKLREKVGGNLAMLFPGHDKDMLLKYPRVAEDVTQLA